MADRGAVRGEVDCLSAAIDSVAIDRRKPDQEMGSESAVAQYSSASPEPSGPSTVPAAGSVLSRSTPSLVCSVKRSASNCVCAFVEQSAKRTKFRPNASQK